MARTHRSSAQNTLRHLGERGFEEQIVAEGTLRSEEVWHGN